MNFRHTWLGLASMAASLGAIGFLLVSDVAGAGESAAPPAQAAAQTKEGGTAKEVAPVLKAKAKPRRKRIDLGRFEGY
jgi:hypothetical protein